MSSPRATAIIVGCTSLLHLLPKFSVTVTFTITGTKFGNCSNVTVKNLEAHLNKSTKVRDFVKPVKR